MSGLTEALEYAVFGEVMTRDTGTPDVYKIRMLEEELLGDRYTEYPGSQWREITREQHLDHSAYYMGYPPSSGYDIGCLWCEDDYRRGKILEAEARTRIVAERKPRKQPGRVARNLPLIIVAGTWITAVLIIAIVAVII